MTVDDVLKNATVITLRKRPDRGASFLSRFQTLTGRAPRIVYGFDGDRVPIPTGWQTSKGAFGCCLAHVAAQMRVLSDEEYSDDDPLAFFEDDAVFCDGFLDKLETVAKFVPDDWEILYLGGELLLTGRPKPTAVAAQAAGGASSATGRCIWRSSALPPAAGSTAFRSCMARS